MLAELKEITAKKREIRFSRMSDPIWIFLNFFGGFFRIVDVNPVSIDNSDFKIIPSSVCGQGGPAKKKNTCPEASRAPVFLCFLTVQPAHPEGGRARWATGILLVWLGRSMVRSIQPPPGLTKPPRSTMQLWCNCGSFNRSSDHIHHNTPNHAHFGAHSACFGVFQPAIRPLIHPTTPNAPHFGSMGESMRHIKPPRNGIEYGDFRLI